MVLASDIIKDFDEILAKYSTTLIIENRALKQKLAWAKHCFKQALEVMGEEGDSRVEYLAHMYLNFFEE